MSNFLYRNSLSIFLFSVFTLTIVGQALAGWKALEQELAIDGLPPLRLLDYLGTGHFRSALFENWESEFLQLSAYVLLTVFLRQKGSPESKELEGEGEEDVDPERPIRMRRGRFGKDRSPAGSTRTRWAWPWDCCSSSPCPASPGQHATYQRESRARGPAAHHRARTSGRISILVRRFRIGRASSLPSACSSCSAFICASAAHPNRSP